MRRRQSKFSPILKIQRELELAQNLVEAQSYTCIHQPTCNNRHQSCAMHMGLSDFKPSSEEKKAISILQEEVYMYMLQKQVSITRPDGCVFLNIKDYFKAHRTTTTERSTVTYLRVLDAVSDSNDTMMEVLQDLHQKFKGSSTYLLREMPNRMRSCNH